MYESDGDNRHLAGISLVLLWIIQLRTMAVVNFPSRNEQGLPTIASESCANDAVMFRELILSGRERRFVKLKDHHTGTGALQFDLILVVV